MAYQGNVAPIQVMDSLNGTNLDVKRALKNTQSQINDIIAAFADPNRPLVIDGRKFTTEAEKNSQACILAVNNKMEQLQNQNTTIVSVFSELFRLEKSIGGGS
jgi:hypothetical protein